MLRNAESERPITPISTINEPLVRSAQRFMRVGSTLSAGQRGSPGFGRSLALPLKITFCDPHEAFATNSLALSIKQKCDSGKSIDAVASAGVLPTANVSQLVEKAARDWLEAAMAGDFAAAWDASDEIRRAR